MMKLSNIEVEQIELSLKRELPRFYRKLLVEVGAGETISDCVIYHPSEIDELYEYKFDDDELLYKTYFPIGCNNLTQELWVIDVMQDKVASIHHETHEDDWPNENWSEYEEWVDTIKI
jgi:hypothetical protein